MTSQKIYTKLSDSEIVKLKEELKEIKREILNNVFEPKWKGTTWPDEKKLWIRKREILAKLSTI